MSLSFIRFVILSFACILVAISTRIIAQSPSIPPDSLKQIARFSDNPAEQAQAFNFLSQIFSNTSLDSSLMFSHKALSLVHQYQLDSLQSDVYNTLAIIYIKRGQPDMGFIYLDSVIVVGEAQQNASAQLSANINLAALYYQTGDYSNALLHNLQALKIAEQEKDTLGIASTHLNICGIYFIQKEFEKGRESALKSLSLYRTLNNPFRISQALINLGAIHIELDKMGEVEKYANEALSIATEIGDLETQGDALRQLAKHASKNEKYQQSLDYYTQSLELLEMVGTQMKITEVKLSLAQTFQQLGQLDASQKLFESVVTKAVQINARHLKRDALEGLMKISANKRNYQDAWDYSQQYIAVQEWLINKENLRQINLLNQQFESENQAAAIAQLKAENELQSVLISQKETDVRYRNVLLVLLALVLVLVLIISYFIRRQNQLKLQKKSTELEHRALRNQMNPHFIFNCLNSIQRLYIEDKRAEANDYMGDFADLLRKILDNSNKQAISLHEELATLQLYLELEKVRCPNAISYEIIVDNQIDPHQLNIPPLILQPFVENAIWHGILPNNKPGIIRIEIVPAKKGYRFLIEDNGIGIQGTSQRQNNRESHGIRITTQRIGRSVSIDPIAAGGTRVAFTLNAVI